MRDVANSATTIRARAPRRSDQGARLKNSHHTTITRPAKTPPIIPYIEASGTKMGRTNQASHCNTTATTPGHSLSGFRGAGSSASLVVIAALRCDSSVVLIGILFTPNIDFFSD